MFFHTAVNIPNETEIISAAEHQPPFSGRCLVVSAGEERFLTARCQNFSRGAKDDRLFELCVTLGSDRSTPASDPFGPILPQAVQAELDARRSDWAVSLDQLAQYTDSLEKELIKMASNMRRSRTEILHLSVRWGRRFWIFLLLCLCCVWMCSESRTEVLEWSAERNVWGKKKSMRGNAVYFLSDNFHFRWTSSWACNTWCLWSFWMR